MDNIIGRKLDGRYEIQEIIGVGGMAIVYKAYDSIDDRIVAVKVLKDEYLANEDFRRRFKNESKAIAVLSHPNIVKVYDVSFGEKIQYIVMEYVDGITLKEYIDQQKVLTWKEAVHFTVQILRALQHAHEKGVVHRDIKPQNIMMLEDGTIKVADFGIARFANSETRTITDKAIGSVHYISPEQARGGVTDKKSDIYSVGVMLYEMLTGRLPFESDNAVSVAIMQMQQDPRRPRELNDQIPEGLEDITLRAMQKDPAERYQSAADMLADIDRFKQNPSIHFEYKYFIDESPTKYVDAIQKVKGTEETPVPMEGKKTKKAGIAGKKRPVIPALTAIMAVLVLVVLGLVLFAMYKTGVIGPRTQDEVVPNLVGQNYNDVKANPSYVANFNIVQQTTAYSDTVAKDLIISQTPEKGTTIKKNGTIKVTVSLGANMVTVDDVTNQDASVAYVTLKNQGLNPTQVQQNSDTVTTGYVISTDPAAGASVKNGSDITIYVSSGPKVITETVPDLSKVSESSAQSVIEKAGLKANVTEQEDATKDAGTFISQSPAAGSTAPQNTQVTVIYSKKPAVTTTSVPDATKKFDADAKALLSAYTVQTSIQTGSGYASGYVYQQNPGAGSQMIASKDTTVTLYEGDGTGMMSVWATSLSAGTSNYTNYGFSQYTVKDASGNTIDSSQYSQCTLKSVTASGTTVNFTVTVSQSNGNNGK